MFLPRTLSSSQAEINDEEMAVLYFMSQSIFRKLDTRGNNALWKRKLLFSHVTPSFSIFPMPETAMASSKLTGSTENAWNLDAGTTYIFNG